MEIPHRDDEHQQQHQHKSNDNNKYNENKYIIEAEIVNQTVQRASFILDKYESFARKKQFNKECDDSDTDEGDHQASDIQYKLEIAHYYYVRNLKVKAFKNIRDNVDNPPGRDLADAFYKFKLLAKGFDSWRVFCFVQKRDIKLLREAFEEWRMNVAETELNRQLMSDSHYTTKLQRNTFRAWQTIASYAAHIRNASERARAHIQRRRCERVFGSWRQFAHRRHVTNSLGSLILKTLNQTLQRKVIDHWVQATIAQLQRKRALTLSGAHYKINILEKSFGKWIRFVTYSKQKAIADRINRHKIGSKVLEKWCDALDRRRHTRIYFSKWTVSFTLARLKRGVETRLCNSFFRKWQFATHFSIYEKQLEDNARNHFNFFLKRKLFQTWAKYAQKRRGKLRLVNVANTVFRLSVCQKIFANWRKQLRVVQCRKAFDSYFLESAFRLWVRQLRVHMHARKVVLRKPFREWRAVVVNNTPARNLRTRVLRAGALNTKERAFFVWRKLFMWRRFVMNVAREYAVARTRGFARVALRRWKRWAVQKAIKSEVFRFARGRINNMKVNFALQRWKAFTSNRKERHLVQVRAVYQYQDRLLSKAFQHWKEYIGLVHLAKEALAKWKTLKYMKSERDISLDYIKQFSVVRLDGVKLRTAFTAWYKYHEAKQEEKVLAELYKRKLVKTAFSNWQNLFAFRSQQTATAFTQKGKAMEELLKYHFELKLAELHFLRTLCHKYFKKWETKSLFLSRCAIHYCNSNLLFNYFSKWKRNVKKLEEAKQVKQYEESAKIKRGYLARHHQHSIYQRVGPNRLSPQVEHKPSPTEMQDLNQSTKMSKKTATLRSRSKTNMDSSGSIPVSPGLSQKGSRLVASPSPSPGLPDSSIKIEWIPDTNQILRSPTKPHSLRVDTTTETVSDIPTPRQPPTPQSAPVFPKIEKSKSKSKKATDNLSRSPQRSLSPSYRHEHCYTHGSESPTKYQQLMKTKELKKSQSANKLKIIKHKVQGNSSQTIDSPMPQQSEEPQQATNHSPRNSSPILLNTPHISTPPRSTTPAESSTLTPLSLQDLLPPSQSPPLPATYTLPSE